MRARSLRPRPVRRGDDDGSILPLINVVFLLLIFFMVVGHLAAADPFHIEPPASASEAEPGDPGHVVLVGTDGRIAVDGVTTDEDGLKDVLAGLPETQDIRLKADGAVSAVRLVQVMETMRAGGVTKLHLLTIPRAE